MIKKYCEFCGKEISKKQKHHLLCYNCWIGFQTHSCESAQQKSNSKKSKNRSIMN